MSERRYRPPNRWGFKPDEDVCVQHDLPLECRHGCKYVLSHKCKDRTDPQWEPSHDPDKLITVCDKCLTASCWNGIFMCEQAEDAGIVQKTYRELIILGLEHPSYFK